MSRNGAHRRALRASGEWLGCCFDCERAELALWRFSDDPAAGLTPRQVARRWMLGHQSRNHHDSLIILYARRDDGAPVDALPASLTDSDTRRTLLGNITRLEVDYRQRQQLNASEPVTVWLPGGYLIETPHAT